MGPPHPSREVSRATSTPELPATVPGNQRCLYHHWRIDRVCMTGQGLWSSVLPQEQSPRVRAQQHQRMLHTLGSRVSLPSPSLGPQARGRPGPWFRPHLDPGQGDRPQGDFWAVYSLLREGVCGPRAPEP